MSIKAIHLFFIVMAVLISGAFGIWSLKFAPGEESLYTLLGIVSLAATAALIVYGYKFYRKMTTL